MTMLRSGLGVAILSLLADQLSKWAVLAHMTPLAPEGRLVHVMPGFNIVLVANRGVTFGMFNQDSSANVAVFTAIAFAIVAILLWVLRRARNLHTAVALGMIIGGAIGNVIDRLRFGAVVDFLDFYVGNWHWYTFNVADSGICVGVGILLLDGLLTPSVPAE